MLFRFFLYKGIVGLHVDVNYMNGTLWDGGGVVLLLLFLRFLH